MAADVKMTKMDSRLLDKRSDCVSLAVVTVHLFVVACPVYLAAAVGPHWLLPCCWLFFGLSMNGVLNMMHECSHYHMFKDRRWSDWLGRRVLAPFVFADFDAYRRRHWDHHRFVGVDGDTKDTYLIDIRGWAFLRMIVRCALMGEAIKKFFKQTSEGTAPERQFHGWVSNILVFQSLFALSILSVSRTFHASLGWDVACYYAVLAYGAVYLYGLMSLTILMASLRAIAEHQEYDDGSAQCGRAALRNFTCHPVSRYLMGAYGFGEHYTHHRVPSIPYYRLKAATVNLADEDASFRPGKGYFGVLADIVTR